jgi:hypothetical protein
MNARQIKTTDRAIEKGAARRRCGDCREPWTSQQDCFILNPASSDTEQPSRRPPTRAPQNCQTPISAAVRHEPPNAASIKGLQLGAT